MICMTRKTRMIKTVFCLLFITVGCATYYQRNIKFQELFVQGKIEEAKKELNKNKRAAKDKNRLLYYLQNGVVLQILDKFEESNEFFENAYIFTEDLQKNHAAEAYSLLYNPEALPYSGEDFERILIHYYKAMNYLRQNKLEEALVECRRINIKLNQLNDKYGKNKNRYKSDAFALNLMGIIFEVSGDYNSAFISYRNAYETYEGEYKPLFGVSAPLQLKKDLLRCAYLNGFIDELGKYEKQFGMKYSHDERDGGELVFFWHNGLGPVKGEWSINFFVVRGKGGQVTFVNEDRGLSFPFYLDDSDDSVKLGDLKFVRIAFPKYLERKTYFRNAELIVSGEKYPLELAQDINAIALKTLEDRMTRELANTLLRFALKQASENVVRKKSESLGALLSVANALSEKADTRNWQTLPYSISYARIPLSEGESTIELKSYSHREVTEHSEIFQLEIEKNKTVFYVFHNLESIPLGQ